MLLFCCVKSPTTSRPKVQWASLSTTCCRNSIQRAVICNIHLHSWFFWQFNVYGISLPFFIIAHGQYLPGVFLKSILSAFSSGLTDTGYGHNIEMSLLTKSPPLQYLWRHVKLLLPLSALLLMSVYLYRRRNGKKRHLLSGEKINIRTRVIIMMIK